MSRTNPSVPTKTPVAVTLAGRTLQIVLTACLTFSTLSLWAGPIAHFERDHPLILRTPPAKPNPSPEMSTGPVPEEYVRVDQVGYAATGKKTAVLMTSAAVDGAKYRVVDAANGKTVFTGFVESSRGAWSGRFADTYPLDFTALDRAGMYRIEIDNPAHCASVPFRIDNPRRLYEPALANALRFFQGQRDGVHVVPSIMDRKPAHLNDRFAFVYETPPYRWIDSESTGEITDAPRMVGGPVDVSGGWYDAGDYLKFVETASFNTMLMWIAVDDCRRLPRTEREGLTREARYGTDWLLKMWDDKTRTLYYQVGLGDGNDEWHGDHDLWRLPDDDDEMSIAPGDQSFFVKYRPVFRAGPPGSPVSPNLAGRLAASFALAARLTRASDPAYSERCARAARDVYALADTQRVGRLTTASIFEYYPEVEWHDDMSIGATELYRLSASDGDSKSASGYLHAAAHWALEYLLSANNGEDTLNLYDCGGLADYELCRVMGELRQANVPLDSLEVTEDDVRGDLRDQIRMGLDQARMDPFRLAVTYDNSADQTAHALGLALEADFYAELVGVAGPSDFAGLGSPVDVCHAFRTNQLNWVLGENAWGSSFIIGDGAVYPLHPHHQIANLTLGPNGQPLELVGAAVNGPAPRSNIPDDSAFPRLAGMRDVNSDTDPFAPFDNDKARYVDRVDASQCVEPCDDCTALSLLIFARLAGR